MPILTAAVSNCAGGRGDKDRHTRTAFNPPPIWPQAPNGWVPEVGWLPPADWPLPPANWPLFKPVYSWPTRIISRPPGLVCMILIALSVVPIAMYTNGPFADIIGDLAFYGAVAVIITGLVQRRRRKREAQRRSHELVAYQLALISAGQVLA